MNPVIIIKALLKKLHLIILFPVIAAAIVIYLQRQKPQEFQSGMMFYTGIASGNNLSSQSEGRVDNIAVHNAFDNLITILESRETLEEVAMRLLTRHLLLNEPNPFLISPENLYRLHHELIPKSLFDELIKGNQFETTLQRVREKYRDSQDNQIIHLINSSSTFYNVDNIKKGMSASRKRNSDMLEVIYRSSDPGVCLLSLQYFAEVFIEKNISLRNYETGGIIDYFLAELEKARNQLNVAEEALKDYSQENQVINYNEQTKFLASAKEDLERDINLEDANIMATQQTLDNLEDKLSEREKIYLNSRNIINKRNDIARINSRIIALEIFLTPENKDTLAALKSKIQLYENELLSLTSEYKAQQYSIETLPRESLLNQWLVHAIEYDKSQERLKVLKSQRNYFNNSFNQYAPIGFNLSKMEREIDIAEREYLSILHGLNLARLRQSNLELFGTLEILDQPFFPLNPKGSKMKMMAIGAFLASLFFVTGLIVGIELLDRTMRTPALAQSYTGLDALGAMAGKIRNKNVNSRVLNEQLHFLLCNKLALSRVPFQAGAKALFFVYSTRKQLGIAQAGLAVAAAIFEISKQVIYIYRNGSEDIITPDSHSSNNSNDSGFKVKAYHETFEGIQEAISCQETSNCPIVIQLPEFERQSIADLLHMKPDMAILVVSATQTWEYQDKQMLESFTESLPNIQHKVFVSNILPDYLDDFLAEVPRKRSFLRKWLKKILRLNF